jgi:hypothetical protein
MEDLEKDCRKSMKRALLNKAIPMEMDSWNTDFADPVDVCRRKIEKESTHYIGVFAYRRGWTPQVLKGKSITEAEFDWASEYKKTLAVLLPKIGTDFDTELRRRAANQTEEEAQAQQNFLKRVRDLGTIMPFEDVAHLENKIVETVLRWDTGSFRQVAKIEISPETARKRKLIEDKLTELGRPDHGSIFEKLLKKIMLAAPEAGCFVIHGEAGLEHEKLSARLAKKLEGSDTEVKRCRINVRTDWRQKNVQSLINVLALELSLDISANSIETVAEQLKKLLEIGEVALEFTDLQRLEGSLPKFTEDFWRPLMAALPASINHRLIGLLSFEGALKPEWKDFLYVPGDDADYDPKNLILLPELTNFDEEDVFVWLKERGFKTETAKEYAATWITETKGNPAVLYAKIKKELLEENEV